MHASALPAKKDVESLRLPCARMRVHMCNNVYLIAKPALRARRPRIPIDIHCLEHAHASVISVIYTLSMARLVDDQD